MDPFAWLDAIFGGGGGGGGGYSSSGPGPRLDMGFAPVAGWMVNQAFNGAGPVGHYFGMAFGHPGSGIPRVQWGTEGSYLDHGTYLDLTYDYGDGSPQYVAGGGTATGSGGSRSSGTGEVRRLETLDRAGGGGHASAGPVEEVTVLGSPPNRPPTDWFERFLQTPSAPSYSGPENPIRWPDPPMARPTRPKRPAAPRTRPVDPVAPVPEPSRPEQDPASLAPAPETGAGPVGGANPWLTDAPAPPDLRDWGFWEGRPEAMPTLRPERGTPAEVGAVPRVPDQRGFFDRGGTGLVAGAVSVGVGVAVLMWWNPVGWAAGVGVALALAGGVAATAASAVELGGSYAGVTTAAQDAEMNRAVGATLGYSSVGGVLGSVAGTVLADDPRAGFEHGGVLGGFGEGAAGLAISLPSLLRASPGLGRAVLPWTKSLFLEPLWFLMAAGGSGGGRLRSTARVFAAQGRLASGIRQVEYLGTTPVLETNAAWARYQVFATGQRDEAVFRLTYAGGAQRIVLADAAPAFRARAPYRIAPDSQSILEAKYGDMGQMWNLEREAHIMRQVNNYLDISRLTGGRVGYLVSTETGASRLAQRFGREFPAEVESGQLWVDWLSW